MHVHIRKVACIALIGLAGCAASTQSGPARPEQPATTVQVENQNFLDMTIYLVQNGRRFRLGDVPGVSTRTMVIPERFIFGISSLQFQADPLGSSRAPISQSISVSQGDALRLIIPPG